MRRALRIVRCKDRHTSREMGSQIHNILCLWLHRFFFKREIRDRSKGHHSLPPLTQRYYWIPPQPPKIQIQTNKQLLAFFLFKKKSWKRTERAKKARKWLKIQRQSDRESVSPNFFFFLNRIIQIYNPLITICYSMGGNESWAPNFKHIK